MSTVTNYILRSDGEEFAQTYKVKQLVVLHEANRISRAKIILIDGDVSQQDFFLSNLDFFIPGKVLEIELGFENDLQRIFTGIITRHAVKVPKSNESVLEIECKHQAVVLTKSQGNRVFTEKSDKAAVEEILAEKGIDVQAGDWEEYTQEQLVQYGSTDWDFIRSRVVAHGLFLLAREDGLEIMAADPEQEPVITCEYGRNVIEFEGLLNAESQSGGISGSTWAPADQELRTAEGHPTLTNSLGNLNSSDLSAPWEGNSDLLQHPGNLPQEELDAWVNARATRNELSKAVGRMRISGTHEVYPGDMVNLRGFGDRFEGKAWVSAVRHEMQKGNWTVDIQFGLPPARPIGVTSNHPSRIEELLPGAGGLHIGKVTQLEGDPEAGFRLRVRIPSISDDSEGIWARLAQSYAGDGYGFFIYPEIDDEVLVGFIGDDLRHAVVLASLHSSAHAAPGEVSDQNDLKSFTTRSGLKMEFDDGAKVIRIETLSGNRIALDESAQSILIEDEHGNTVEMKSDGIALESLQDIRIKATRDVQLEGVNIDIKANGKFTASGNAGADVTSSAIAVLKGSLVQIN